MAKDKFKSIDQLRDALELLCLEYVLFYKGKEYHFEGTGNNDTDRINIYISPLFETDGTFYKYDSFDDMIKEFDSDFGVSLQDFIKEAEIEEGSVDIESIGYMKNDIKNPQESTND